MIFEQFLRRPKPAPAVQNAKIRLPPGIPSLAVLLLATKGGTGKSNATIHSAVAAAMDGLKVLVLDTDLDDDQITCRRWANIRGRLGHSQPLVVKAAAEKACEAVTWGRQQGYQVIIVDTAGRDRVNMSALVDVVDFAVTPAQPTWLDLEATGPLARIWRSTKTPSAILLNGAASSHSARTRYFQERFRQIGPTLDAVLTRRMEYQDPLAVGLGASEWNPGGVADIEIRRFVREVFRRVAASRKIAQ